MFPQDIDPEDIKAAIRKRGVTLAELGRSHGISRQTMSLALHERASPKAERVIAEFLGLPLCKIWPSRYDRAGRRLSRLEMRKAAA